MEEKKEGITSEKGDKMKAGGEERTERRER